jgi:hypothetical protein
MKRCEYSVDRTTQKANERCVSDPKQNEIVVPNSKKVAKEMGQRIRRDTGGGD